jgi:hypothetical protein
MTDIWAQLQPLVDQYWQEAVAAVFIVGAIAIYRARKGKTTPQGKGLEHQQAPTQPGVDQYHSPTPDHTEEYVDIMIRVPARAQVSMSPITKAEDAELRNAVPPSYGVLPPLLTPTPIQLPTKVDTPVSTKAHEPRTPEEKDITRKALELVFGGGSG